MNKSLWAAFTTSLVTFLLGSILGFLSVTSVSDEAFLGSGASALHFNFWEILGRNLAAALLLYSGVITGGLSTLIGLILTSAFVGATFGVAANSVGFGTAAGSVVLYAPLEFLGLLLVATAGFWPVHRAVGRIFSKEQAGPRAIHAYVNSLGGSMKILGVGAVVIALAAVAESLVITLRN